LAWEFVAAIGVSRLTPHGKGSELVKHNILLVDDAVTDLRLLGHILEALGHNILAVQSGEEALERVQDTDISVVLLDVRLPGISGYEVAQRMRSPELDLRIPVIFVTGSADLEEEIFDGYFAGGVDYLVKPVEPAIVRRKVQIFCELKDKERQIEEQLRCIEEQKSKLEKQVKELGALDEARMESEIRYRSLVTMSPQAILVQVQGILVFYNTMAIQMLGSIDEASMHERPFHTFVDESDRDRIEEWLEQIERRGGRSEPTECRIQNHHDDDACRHVELHACCILYDDEVGVQMAIQDITEHKLLAEKLRMLSQIDGLTGVRNRRSFDQQIEKEWLLHARSKKTISLLMIDLDQFKKYNDTYGHLDGDGCLRAVADVMGESCCRPADMVARYGGEEFAILLPDTDASGAEHIALRLVEAVERLQKPHTENKTHGIVTVSCGVATARPADGEAQAQLIRAADKALYDVKRDGGNGVASGDLR
jgi:two-component system, cell cycle response regulator